MKNNRFDQTCFPWARESGKLCRRYLVNVLSADIEQTFCDSATVVYVVVTHKHLICEGTEFIGSVTCN